MHAYIHTYIHNYMDGLDIMCMCTLIRMHLAFSSKMVCATNEP